jgi:hypothetical protein
VSARPDSGSSPRLRTGVDLPTLLITAVASAAAAYACSKLWAPGTLASAAAMPVLVAIIKEALARPTEAVTRAVPVRGVVRSAPPPGAPAPPAPPPTERVPQQGEITYHASGWSARRWRLAIVTGLLGFLIAALVLTVPELVSGRSASGGGRSTTLFGGDHEKRSRKPRTQTTTVRVQTVTVKTRTVIVPERTKTVTAPPVRTTTVPAPTTTTTTTPTTTQPPG